jgi:hypothetical protein
MRLNNLVAVERFANLDAQSAPGNLLNRSSRGIRMESF